MFIRTIVSTLILLVTLSVANAQTIELPKLIKLKTPDTEVADAILFLKDLPEIERRYIKFFSTYAISNIEARQHASLFLSFLCHSMIGAVNKEFPGGGYYPIAHMEYKDDNDLLGKFVGDRLIPGSDTLYWVDLREFNWTEQAWENMSKEDGYFVEPVVTHEKNSLLRLYSGNAVIRTDWFIQHASSITSQSDVNSNTKIYKEFLYGSVGKAPTNVTEFEKIWAIDTKKAREIGNFYATLVTKSKNVARNNRILAGYRTELGWYYRSYDVKNMRGKRDYAENIVEFKGNPPIVFDGGEIFATNILQMQVYDLYNDKEALVDFGDPTLVRHMSDILGDARVTTPHSCFDCHAAGPIPSENTLSEFIKSRSKVYSSELNDSLRMKRVYLDQNFENSIGDNQTLFARSLKNINGLKPEENAKFYLEQISNYNKALDINQVAFECGVTPDKFKESMTDDNKIIKNKVPFRIGALLTTGEEIPRLSWESPGADGQPGLFQQAMIIIHGLTSITYEDKVVNSNTAITNTNRDILKDDILVFIKDSDLRSGNSTLKSFKIGDTVIADGKNTNGWIGVQSNDGIAGYVRSENVKLK